MTDLLAERGMLGCKPVNTSMDPNLQFSQDEGEAFPISWAKAVSLYALLCPREWASRSIKEVPESHY